MLKLFISQTMNGKTDKEILQEREQIVSRIKAHYGSVEVIDSFVKENAPKDVNVSLWYLSKSIEFLSMADVAYFAQGWQDARGCKIEHECAEAYGIKIIGDMRPMELKDTVEMMGSEDYKERFKAEYYQVKIRYGKLKYMLERWDNELLDFTPTCPRSTYDMQIRTMSDYIAILEMRAAMEGITLPN